MGVHIHLYIQPRRIEPAAWAEAYDEVLGLLREHPDELMGLRRHQSRPRRWYYSRQIEHESASPRRRHFAVCGDMRSRETAEGFEMYRDLANYRERAHKPDTPDVVLANLQDAWTAVDVFGGKTQGRPLHSPILAAAMLVESRFPTAAMTCGEIDKAQAQQAGRWAESVLGRSLPLPVCVDAPALIRRLRPHLQGEELQQAFHRLYCGDAQTALQALMGALGREVVLGWVRGELRSFESPDQLGVRRLYVDWLNAGGELLALCRASCLDPEGPRFPPEAVVSAIVATWVTCEHDDFAYLDRLLRPPGATDSPSAQLMGFFLDAGSMGRHIRCHIALPEVVAVLQQCFPAQAASLTTRLAEETDRLRRSLKELRAPVSQRLREAQEAAEELDAQALLSCRALSELPWSQQRLLRFFALQLGRVAEQMEREGDLRTIFQGSPERRHEAVLGLLEHQGIDLTEDAWDWLDRETDERVVRFLLGLACIGDRERRVSEMRRGLLENRVLCHEMIRLMQDPQIRDETEREVAALLDRTKEQRPG